MKLLVCLSALLWAAIGPLASAGSATWSANPASGDWNTSANWIPNTVPNGTSDMATFGTSNVANVVNTGVTVSLDGLVFKAGASLYTISASDDIALYGPGIVNNSGKTQSFVVGGLLFFNSAAAGAMINFTNIGGVISFNDTSSAGSAFFAVTSGDLQAEIEFRNGSTAGNATIVASAGAMVSFLDESLGGNASLNLSSGSVAVFPGAANAQHMIGSCGDRSVIEFGGTSSAGDGVFTAIGATAIGVHSGSIEVEGSATANNATFILEGATTGGVSSTLTFSDAATAGAAKITANYGSFGGMVFFQDDARGDTASITLNLSTELRINTHNAPGVTIGSLAGDGKVVLGVNTLTIGSNNGSTTFSGVIESTGGVAKIGTGTLTLTGANLYGGHTTVSGGALVANTRRGSATGTGSVTVNGGTLGGKGMISGPVTVGKGSGSGAILAPSVGSKQPLTLSLTNTLTCKADSTYTCQLSTQKRSADEVIAKGVTIASGAQFTLQAVGNKKLPSGTVFTLLSNTSASPINGTFANLPDGSTLTAGRNKLLVSYTGGDGNDLTLTLQ